MKAQAFERYNVTKPCREPTLGELIVLEVQAVQIFKVTQRIWECRELILAEVEFLQRGQRGDFCGKLGESVFCG